MKIELKVSLYFIAHVTQVLINREFIAAAINERLYAPGLSAYFLHDPHLIDDPKNRRLPIIAFNDTLQGLIGRHGVGGFFTAHAGNGIGE